MELLKKANGNLPRTQEEKEKMIEEAAFHYGNFLTAMGFDWKADYNSADTPRRVAKAWVNDLIEGCVNEPPKITNFPNEEGYTGLVCQTKIPVTSLCSHHNQTVKGFAHVAYIPGKHEDGGRVIGLSKLNRIVEFYARRPQLQEALTKQVHDEIDKQCVANRGVAVVIEATHNCTACRGVRHDSEMKTSQLSGYFFDNEVGTRTEFFTLIGNSR